MLGGYLFFWNSSVLSLLWWRTAAAAHYMRQHKCRDGAGSGAGAVWAGDAAWEQPEVQLTRVWEAPYWWVSARGKGQTATPCDVCVCFRAVHFIFSKSSYLSNKAFSLSVTFSKNEKNPSLQKVFLSSETVLCDASQCVCVHSTASFWFITWVLKYTQHYCEWRYLPGLAHS